MTTFNLEQAKNGAPIQLLTQEGWKDCVFCTVKRTREFGRLVKVIVQNEVFFDFLACPYYLRMKDGK